MTGTDIGLELISMPPRFGRQAPPLLFIHGGFHGAWCWEDHFMPWFAARGFSCHAVSLRDHGSSRQTGQHKSWRLCDYVDDVRWAVEQLNCPPILVGHSLGGSIAQKIAAELTIPGMILLAPSPIGGSNRAALRMLFTHPKSMWRALSQNNLGLGLPAFLGFFLSPDLPVSERERVCRRLDGLTALGAAADAFYRDTPKPVTTAMPTLVVSGQRDWSIPLYKNAALARAYGGSHLIVPTAHDMMADTNWEVAAQRILNWLDEYFPNGAA
ncbi:MULTISPECIES: alpha/beta hydrolase [Hyphobacterium]|uniref:Alpha/beta hydrolase n=1 Tax=Hyphobacterium vulgare TaxID=1736751 RepID=A0ABV6ZYB1_9PROT